MGRGHMHLTISVCYLEYRVLHWTQALTTWRRCIIEYSLTTVSPSIISIMSNYTMFTDALYKKPLFALDLLFLLQVKHNVALSRVRTVADLVYCGTLTHL